MVYWARLPKYQKNILYFVAACGLTLLLWLLAFEGLGWGYVTDRVKNIVELDIGPGETWIVVTEHGLVTRAKKVSLPDGSIYFAIKKKDGSLERIILGSEIEFRPEPGYQIILNSE